MTANQTLRPDKISADNVQTSAEPLQNLCGTSAVELLAAARAAGLQVETEGDRLRVRGPRSAGALGEALLACKAEVLALLDGSPPVAQSLPDDWDQPGADVLLQAALADLDRLRPFATVAHRRRLLADADTILRRWHREHDPLLWSAIEQHDYLLRLWQDNTAMP